MKLFTCAALSVATLFVAGVALGAEDPTGTWKWTVMFQNQERETTLKLKLEGGKLTGGILGRNNQETAIEDGTFSNDEVSFKITRERNGQKFTTTYKAKVSGDTLKGTIEAPGRNNEARSRPWEAKRSN